MQNQLEKAINLCKKTGDRLIVFDGVRSENPFVVMNLEEYEKIALGRSEVKGLTEEEMLDKINRDIAVWKSDQEEVGFETETSAQTQPEETENKANQGEKAPKKQWSIPSDVKEGAEEIIEEDRQYLEEVSF